MSLARSASGPGGLSINTGAANIFGSSSTQPPAAGGLFGSTTAPATGSTPSLFGTTATTPSAPAPGAGGGLFGSAATNTQPTTQAQTPNPFASTTSQLQQPAATGGGLFGSTNTATPTPTGGLFGSGTNTATAQTGGGLFGSGTSAAPAQPAQTQTGGLFGSAPTGTAAQPQTGGLFGSTTTQQQPQSQTQQPAAGGGLFSSTMPQPAANTGLFGQTQPKLSIFNSSLAQPQQQQSGSIFGRTVGGASTSAPGLTMGQPGSQQQQVIPGVRIDLSNLKSTTRFNDLQESLQKEIQALDRGIQAVMQQCHDVEAFMPAHGEQLAAIPNDVRFVMRKYEGASNTLASDAQAVKAMRELVHTDAEHAKLSFKAVDNLRLPSQYHTAGLWSSAARTGQQESGVSSSFDAASSGDSNSDLISFFSRTADEMEEQLRRFQQGLSEIEAHMHAVNANLVEQIQRAVAASRIGDGSGTSSSAASSATDDKIAELASVLRGFEESILGVASVVGSAREGVTALQLGDFRGTSGLSGGAS